MKRAIFQFLSILSLTLLHAQEDVPNHSRAFRNEYFAEIGFIKPLVSSWKYPSEAFDMTPSMGYSVHFGFRRFYPHRPAFFQFSVGRRMTNVDYKMKQEYVNELSPDYQVRVRIGGWQGITDINFGLGTRVQLGRFFYLQPACILGIATRGNFSSDGLSISSSNQNNLDSTKVKIESYPMRYYSGDLGLSIELSLQTGVKLGKRHSIGFQGSLVQYGIGLGPRRPSIFSLHSAKYRVYNSQKSYELNTSLMLRGYSLALTYHYSF